MEKLKILIIALSAQTILSASSDPLAKFYTETRASVISQDQKQTTPQLSLGRVSMDLLFLLHPKMKNYNFNVDSFFINLPKKLSVPVEFYLKDKHKNFKKYRSKALSKKKNMMEEVNSKKVELNLLRQDYIKNNNELLRMTEDPNRRKEKYQQLERNYWVKRVELEEKILKIRNQYQEWVSNNGMDLFLNRQERDQLLDEIVQEIKNIVQSVAIKKNINLVFNRNAKTLGTNTNLLKLKEKPFLYTDDKVLEKFLNGEFHFDYSKPGSPSAYLQAFDSYLKHYDSIQATFKSAFEKFDTLGKVHDLTIPSLNLLFTRYKFPKKIKHELLTTIKSWQKS